MTPTQILMGTLEKIATPSTWLRSEDPDVGSLNAAGGSVGSNDPSAVCWCLYHALCAAAHGAHATARDTALVFLATAIEGAAITAVRAFEVIQAWNDVPERTHAEVLAVIDKAIAAADLDERRWSIFDEEFTYAEIRDLLEARGLWSDLTDVDLRAMEPGSCIYFPKVTVQRFK